MLLFFELPFRYSFSQQRRKNPLHMTLMLKMDKPFIDKLRIIQILEDNLNGGLEFFLEDGYYDMLMTNKILIMMMVHTAAGREGVATSSS